MIDVVQVNTRYSKGGAAIIARSIHQYLLEKGWKSTYVFGNNGLSRVNDLHALRIGSFLSAKLNKLVYYYFMKEPLTFNIKRLKKILSETKIVHIHNLHSYYIDYKRFFEIIDRNKPIVWTIHDKWLLTGRCAVPSQCKNYMDMCRECPYPLFYPSSFSRNTYQNYKQKYQILNNLKKLYIVTQSKYITELILNSPMGKAIKNNIEIIPNGINTNYFRKFEPNKYLLTDLGIDYRKKSVLFVAEYLTKEKGFDKFLNLAEKFSDIQFIAVGKITNLKFPYPDNVVITGFIDQEKLANLYNTSTCYLLLSEDENYPTTVLEALSCGCPVISMNVGAVREILKEGGGIVVDNIKEIESVLKEVLYEFTNFNEVKITSIKEMTDMYVELYRKIANE